MPTALPGSRCQIGCRAHGGRPCGQHVDLLGDHAAVCKCGGYKIIRHSRLVCTVRSILRESGATVSPTEVPVAGWRRSDGSGARLDIGFWAGGDRQFVDVTVRHPRARKYVTDSAAQDGAAARTAERHKRERYPAEASAGLHTVLPFAVETFGRLGPGALDLLRAAHQRAMERDSTLRGWAGSALFARWLALLSCELQRSLFDATQQMGGVVGRLLTASPGPLAGSPLVQASQCFRV